MHPTLEHLEDRVVPNASLIESYATITQVKTSYSLLHQIDTVSVDVTPTGANASDAGTLPGTIQVTDNNETNTINVNGSGTYTTTFTFDLFKNAQPKAHTVGALYSGGDDQHMNIILSDAALPAQAADTTKQYNNILIIDAAIVLLLEESLTAPPPPA
jgi:hypothetical protein